MKLALNIGTNHISAALTTSTRASLLPLKNGHGFLDNLALWHEDDVVAIDDAARDQAYQAPPDARVFRHYKNDFALGRLRYTIDDPDHPSARREVCPEGYQGPFFRRGLVRVLGGTLQHFWQHLTANNPKLSPASIGGVLLGVPFAFHEFSRRRYLHALRLGLQDRLFPGDRFYQHALQSVAFVPEPLAALAAATQIYGGRGAKLLSGTDTASILVIDIGSGACECTVIKCKNVDGLLRPIEVLATLSSNNGGLRFDRAIIDGVRAGDPDLDMYLTNRQHEPKIAVQLADHARVVKEQLSDPEVNQTKLFVPEGSPVVVARQQFIEWTSEIIEAIAEQAEESLGHAGLTPADTYGALVVGGTAVMPELQLTLTKRLRELKHLVMPEPHEIEDATAAVTLGLAKYETYAAPVGMAPTNRTIELLNTGWTPHEQVPPPGESFVTLFDPLKPEANKHPAKDFWWGFLQVPPGFRKLTVPLFSNDGRREHLFTLYGVPVSDPDDIIVPERFQVYIDPRGDRMYPRIWVWDVRVKKFLVKVFDLAAQNEGQLQDFVENERPYFALTDGDLFDGHPIGKDLGWIPPVKRLARGDFVRVLTGDRNQPDWFNTRDSQTSTDLETPIQRVTGIYPRNAPMFVGPGRPQVDHWRLSEYVIRLDNEEPRNLQALFVEIVGDESTDVDPLFAPVAGSTATAEPIPPPMPTKTPAAVAGGGAGADEATSGKRASSSGGKSRAPKLAPEPAAEADPFAGAQLPPEADGFGPSPTEPLGGSDLMPEGFPSAPASELGAFDAPDWGGLGGEPPMGPPLDAWSDSHVAPLVDTSALPPAPENWPGGPPADAWSESNSAVPPRPDPALALTDSHSLPSSELRAAAAAAAAVPAPKLPASTSSAPASSPSPAPASSAAVRAGGVTLDPALAHELALLGLPTASHDATIVLDRIYNALLDHRLDPTLGQALVAVIRARVEIAGPPDGFGVA